MTRTTTPGTATPETATPGTAMPGTTPSDQPREHLLRRNDPEVLVAGLNHVAIVTRDLERITRFYHEVFGCERVDVPAPPGSGPAAVVRLGPQAGIAFVEAAAHPDAVGSTRELARGHLDHVALDAASPAELGRARDRLVERGASDGRVHDYGPMLCVSFVDPDGMGSEICWIRDSSLVGLHPPVPVEGPLGEPGISG
jgi:catechol 2,3-dioxygenase-like lactoylglutathione lyase family enzyme